LRRSELFAFGIIGAELRLIETGKPDECLSQARMAPVAPPLARSAKASWTFCRSTGWW
jgi:hypothetical protein